MIENTTYHGFVDVICDSCGKKASLNFFCAYDEMFAEGYIRALKSNNWLYKPEILPSSDWTVCPDCVKNAIIKHNEKQNMEER